MSVEDLICNQNKTIRDAMICIEHNYKRAVFCVNDKKEMVGILTDGDIRRLLIEGYGLNERIANYINKDYVYSLCTESAEERFKKFNDNIVIIPILDAEHHVVDYAEYDEKMHISLAQPQLTGNEYRYLMDAFLSTWISSTGKYVTQFEESFSKYCGVRYGVATSNGTAALHLALLALGIGAGDEVIVPNMTFAATINAVLYTGAAPVIVDIEEDSWCISPDEIERAVTKRTKAVIPVHIYGQPCDMEEICNIAQKHGLYIIEDCAEAHGAEWNGKKVGSFGDISCFSFFGNKVVTTGEGGMCITDNEELAEKMKVYRDHGMRKDRRYYHEVVGYNYRMTNLQAAIGMAQVERIDEILIWRRQLEKGYRQTLKEVRGVDLQRDDLPKRKKITWLVSILVEKDKRDTILMRLKEKGIDTRTFFIPLSDMDIYRPYAFSECVNSQEISARGLNLPTTAEITQQTIELIAACLKEGQAI